jgi:Neuraminidase-like domain/Salmonella virulence plasmid 28.1kDa A protein
MGGRAAHATARDDPPFAGEEEVQAVVKPVIAPLRLRETGPAVTNLHAALSALVEHGAVMRGVDPGTRKRILSMLQDERDRTVFLKATAEVVRTYQEEHGLEASGAVDEETAHHLNADLAEMGLLDETDPPATIPALQGVVVDEHGVHMEGLSLRLYHQAFGGRERVVAEGTTGELGRYTLEFDPAEARAGLQVRAVDDVGKEWPLSNVMYDLVGGNTATVNLVAPTAARAAAPEYERLSADIAAAVGDLSVLGRAKEAEGQRDLTHLNRTTGWDARLLALATQAARLSGDRGTGMAEPVVYSLLRAGLPSDAQRLAEVDSETVHRALQVANHAGIVALDEGQIAEATRQHQEFAMQTRLASPIPGSTATYGEFIAASGVGEDVQRKFASVLLDRSRAGGDLWAAAREAGIEEADVDRFRLQGKLAFVVGNSSTMAARLQTEISDPLQLVERGMYTAARWVEEVREASGGDAKALAELIPPTYAGESVDERLSAYSEDMARKVRHSYNTEVIAHVIANGHDDRFALGETRSDVAMVLNSGISKGFRFGKTSFDTVAKSKPRVFDGVAPERVPAVREEIRSLQRAYQMTPDDDAMEVLKAVGLTSAYDIVAVPLNVFLAQYGPRFKSIKIAELVYRKAQQVSSVTYNLFAVAKKLDAEAPVYGVSAPAEVKESVKTELIRQFPTMETLFGAMDFCECDHCHSVLSPAAYLVDLLQFLDPEEQVWDNFLAFWSERHGGRNYLTEYKKPYNALIARRPDIVNIPLTCENTHKLIPYIDGVNEVLEYFVAHGRLTADAARDTGDAESEDLLAEPANVVREAYDLLLSSRYPHTLPFDLWLEAVRAFCDHFGVSFSDVLETFRPTDELFAPTARYDRFAVFMESLRLSPAHVAILTDTNPLAQERWRELYGYARVPIQNVTNSGDATVAVSDAGAVGFDVGEPCTYFDATAGAAATEKKTIKSVGAAGSAGAGRTRITFEGTWTAAPTNGDLLVVDVPGVLKSAKALARRLRVSYKELIEIVKTGFVNPRLHGLTVLYKLGVTMNDVLTYLRDKPLEAQDPAALTTDEKRRVEGVKAFDQLLADKTQQYAGSGFNATTWFATAASDGTFDDVLIFNDIDAGCDFDATILQYADGDPADAIVFLRIDAFVRLWRLLGWSIEETDRALQTFVPKNAPFDAGHVVQAPLRSALVGLAHAKSLDARVKLGKDQRQKLLTLWSGITTSGKKPLYAQLFLTRALLRLDDVFDDPTGDYLSPSAVAARADAKVHRVEAGNVPPAEAVDATAFAAHPRVKLDYDELREVQTLSYRGVLTDADKTTLAGLSASPHLPGLLDAVQTKALEFTRVKGHLTALQGAFGLTAEDVERVLADAGTTLDAAPLTLANVSLLYRYALLANAVGLTVRDLVTLKTLSGLDPFTQVDPDPLTAIADDAPFTQTIRFVELAEDVRASGLSVADLEYLVFHRYDEAGPHAADARTDLALVRAVGEGVRAIRAEHPEPDDPAELTEEVLRQKLGLVLPADVVDRFLGMMNGTAEFTATKTGVAPADALDPAGFEGEPAIVEISYHATREHQKLTYRGVLFDDVKQALEARLPRPPAGGPHVPSDLLGDLLDDVQAQAAAFFEKHLKAQPAGAQPGGSFLADADFEVLFRPPAPTATDAQLQTRLRAQGTILSKSFLPYLQTRLIRQFVVETMTAYTGADRALIEALLTEARLLNYPAPGGDPLVDALAGWGERGVTATFFDSNDRTGPSLGSALLADGDLYQTEGGVALRPVGTNSARLEGYLEVPDAGPYRFFVYLEKSGARAQITFDAAPAPLPAIVATSNDFTSGGGAADVVELEAGILHRFSVDLGDLGGGGARIEIQGETVPKDTLASVPVSPAGEGDAGDDARILLGKVVRLIGALRLNEREIRYVATHAADFDGLDLSALPTSAGATAGAAQRFAQLMRLVNYAGLKRDMGLESDELVNVLEAPDAQAAYPLIATITRRSEETVKATANAVLTPPAFPDERPLKRLWRALQVVESFGVSVGALVAWTAIVDPGLPAQSRFEIARDLKHTLKARFAPEAWNRVAQPIHDKLRARQRDALVAYVMQQHGFVTREQLYEYFLIDPGMEPVVQTSRIRQAIGAVQLFIQRILLNLEPEVHPSAVNAQHWQWMKRYRVWEANRKIFLFPENWLEPEFRDDKTHLFTELEGTLLQGDVSDDLVENAFLNYLRKLDELARLNVVGMHLEHKADPAQNTLHVIARTYSEPYSYFYRRYAHRVWTPWEPVSAEISGDHLAPVVWRDRLYLFWVTFVEHADTGREVGDQTGSSSLANASLKNVASAVRSVGGYKKIEANLNWSEYLDGEWSSRRAGGLSASPVLGPVAVAVGFDVNTVQVHVRKRNDAGEEAGVEVHLGPPFQAALHLPGRNAQPERAPYSPAPLNPYTATTVRTNGYIAAASPLGVSYTERTIMENGKNATASAKVPQMILRRGQSPYGIVPCDNDIAGDAERMSLIKPIFYQDHAHTLFVEPTLEERRIDEWEDYVTLVPPVDVGLGPEWWDHIVIIPEIPRVKPPRWIDPWDPIWDPPFGDETILGVRPQEDWLINPGTGILLDDIVIGAKGGLDATILTATETIPGGDAGLAERGHVIQVETGGAVASGATLVANSANALQKAGLGGEVAVLNIVGGDGFNTSLAQNLDLLMETNFGAAAEGAAGRWL